MRVGNDEALVAALEDVVPNPSEMDPISAATDIATPTFLDI